MILGIIGAGAMGSGIAQVAAQAQAQVFVYDQQPEALSRARGHLERILARQVEKGRMTAAETTALLGRITWTEQLAELAGSEWVIEAIVEDLGIKQAVFRELEALTGPDTLLATNTSSLSVAAIASACQRPERVMGIHFFNPAPLMKLVELVPAVQTDPARVTQAREVIAAWGKAPVVAKDTPGFIVNRVARPFYGEALKMYEEGLASPATIDWVMTERGGFRMGPFTLMDYIGHDVNFKVTRSVFEAFFYDRRYLPSFAQQRLVEAGYLGKKSGRGFYDYREGAPQPEPERDPQLGQHILDRILALLINEAADALALGIASRDDLDLAMTRGVNYPQGLLAWADEIGIKTCVERLDALYEGFRDPRYRCSPLLRKMAGEGRRFYG